MRLKELGERKILEDIIFNYIELDPNQLSKNEDAVALKINNEYIVVNVDTFVRETDAPPKMTEFHMGYRVVTMTISDLISKGAIPEVLLLSISAPSELNIDELKALLNGVKKACEKYNTKYLGGDFGEASDLILTGIGLGKTKKLIHRNTALPGDSIWVTGPFGNSGAALHYLLHNGSGEKGLIDTILENYFFSPLNLNDGKALRDIASAAMDSSDGLAVTLNTLANQSGIMMEIHNVPVSDIARKYAARNGLDPLDLALFAGEEFEIVFTVRGLSDEDVLNHFRSYDARPPIKIGIAKEGSGVFLDKKRIPAKGWEHFRGL